MNMNIETQTVGSEQWNKATEKWRIYAYNPASLVDSKAEVVSSRTQAKSEAKVHARDFLGQPDKR